MANLSMKRLFHKIQNSDTETVAKKTVLKIFYILQENTNDGELFN